MDDRNLVPMSDSLDYQERQDKGRRPDWYQYVNIF